MQESISLHVLASGSKGNTSVVVNEATGQSILLDCGCRKMDLAGFFDETEYDPKKISGILITHDHSDHIKSLAMLMRYLKKCGAEPFVFTLDPLIKPCKAKTDTDKGSLAEFEAIKVEESIQLAGLSVLPLQTSHDATASCGFFFTADGPDGKRDSLAFFTDTGYLPSDSAQALAQANLIALECNHDEKMLKYGEYPRFLKERIASDHGHLSNAQAAGLIEQYVGNHCRAIAAMHLSQDNNLPSVVRQTVQPTLDAMGLETKLHIARQTSRVSLY